MSDEKEQKILIECPADFSHAQEGKPSQSNEEAKIELGVDALILKPRSGRFRNWP